MFDLSIYLSQTTDPYYNLATEEFLLSKATGKHVILYLWQNDRTVVIGRNQNAWAECRISNLQADGGHLARRLSGGGAVYHDLGNLNFTFLCTEEHYDINRQLSVIQKAVSYAGINSEISGRNDIITEGAKFSGNAFYHGKGAAYHHGTILIDTDFSKLEQYLSPPKAKLESKGIASVRSRVINLKDLSPALTCDIMKTNMMNAFSEVYGSVSKTLQLNEEDISEIQNLREIYCSENWLWGKRIPFTCTAEGRLSFGNIQVFLQIESGIIQDLQVYTDAMDVSLVQSYQKALVGQAFQSEAIKAALKTCPFAQEFASFIIKQTL